MAISAASPTVRVGSPGRRRISRIRSNQPLAEPDLPDRNRRKLYGRRKGPKLSARQSGLRRTLLSELTYRPGDAPLKQFSNNVRELWLEVGFGAGEHLVWQAEHHPDIGLIGAE